MILKLRSSMKEARGVTLVELMIVVAIIGILAALGSIAYSRYIRSGKITKMKTTALEVASGQERYRSRNNRYLSPGGDFATQKPKYQNLLDFAGNSLPQGATVTTESWQRSGPCGVCSAESIPFDNSADGFVVVVKQDLNTSDSNDTTVYVTRSVPDPVILFEGS